MKRSPILRFFELGVAGKASWARRGDAHILAVVHPSAGLFALLPNRHFY